VPGLRKGLLTTGDTSSKPCLGLARQWLDRCVSSHRTCPSSSAPMLPDRVLRLHDGRVSLLESDGVQGHYAALSHCWGDSRPLVTTKATLSAHKLDIPWMNIPKTFQDAIVVTRNLGVSYLWIDSLCILQDDEVDWQRQSSMMADIYSKAHFTIAAVSSKSTTSGMFSVDRPGNFAKDIKPYKIHARRRIPHISHSVDNDTHEVFPLFSRAWAFQERVLSPRMLHFAAHELSWECKELVVCECAMLQEAFSAESHHAKQNSMTAWHDLVSQYSSKLLTYEKDKLPAISGLATAMQRVNGDKYLAGLWRTTFREDMLWSCFEPSPTRPCQYRAPSWSWASIDGRVRFGSNTLVPQLEIGEVKCLPDGVDETGRIKSGSLTLSGRVIPAALFYCNKGKSDSCQYELVFTGLKRQRFRADYALSNYGVHHVPSGTPVSVLIAAEIEDRVTLVCLVLRKLPSNEFERLGSVALDVHMRVASFFGVLQTITII
jgi:hypothetical protein